MTATNTAAAKPTPSARPEPGIADAPPVRLRRRPAMALLAVALIAAGGLTAGFMAQASDSSTAVVVAADTIYRGQTITKADLETTRVSGMESLALTPATDLASLVGQVATTDLPAGVPVLTSSVSGAALPGQGQAVVGILLSPGQLPTVELHPGATVRVLGTPRTQDDPPTSSPVGIAATVVAATTDSVSGHTVVNVLVPEGQATDLAALAATGRVALVLDATQGGAS